MPERFKSTLGRIGRKRMHKDVPEDDEENAYCAKRSKRYGIQELASKMSNGNKEEAGESIETKHKNPQAGDENDGHVIRNLRLSTREKSKRQFPKNPVGPNELYLTVLPGFCQSSLAPAKLGFSARSGLCRRCTELDLDTVLSQPIKTRKARLITNLAPATNWMIDSCAFCSLLSSTLPPASPLLQQSSGHIPLISLSAYQAQGLDWRPLTSNILQLEQNGLDDNRLLVSEPAGIKGTIKFIRENLDVASFDRIKKWIDLCRNSHTKVCSIKEQSTVTGIKLIDCDTNIISPGSEHHYVALSYVWGHVLEKSEDPERLPTRLPDTIKDAIIVTKRLGYRYLWVDRYYINQEDEDEKTHQLARMDSIYRNAELTIIAAAGENPNYGLPGVSHRKRKSEHLTTCARIGKHFLISLSPHSEVSLLGSTWATRGWTYQECILSRRRLVFAESQVYFECYGMYCCESLDFPLKEMHRSDMQGFKKKYCGGKMVGTFPKGAGTESTEIWWRIEEYSRLSLSNPSDILKGMLGIFNVFRRMPLNVYHCWGIPVLPPIPERVNGVWTPAMGFFTGLLWGSEQRSERRSGFPSWSWTGWHGRVEWRGTYREPWPSIKDFKIDPNVQLSIELLDGRVLSCEAFRELSSEDNAYSQLSNFIRISAWSTEVIILGLLANAGEDWYAARVYLDDGGWLDWTFRTRSKGVYQVGGIYGGIILGEDIVSGGPGIALMIVGIVGDVWERIDIVWMDQWNCTRWNKDGVWAQKYKTRNEAVKSRILESSRQMNPENIVRSWQKIRLG
ncbi:HET-domain-containing protein [Hyaloscypha variabilis F]|uniref:HET-domain-containing protein n=1 Tax=Hyaloscypha variabilis (strain UAMH 11265 / GT02V1 / F) TaxID=1149755 RepID=A0A2J6QXT8_HYAVF|nr:HET-domain-containing protein [Hyaloscypha variabilis F]